MMAGWLAGWLVGWLADSLAGWFLTACGGFRAGHPGGRGRPGGESGHHLRGGHGEAAARAPSPGRNISLGIKSKNDLLTV